MGGQPQDLSGYGHMEKPPFPVRAGPNAEYVSVRNSYAEGPKPNKRHVRECPVTKCRNPEGIDAGSRGVDELLGPILHGTLRNLGQ